jgi:pantoate--beta-alanine ligase
VISAHRQDLSLLGNCLNGLRLILFSACSTFACMRIIKSLATMQRLGQRWRRDGLRVGFVPTMGYLHAGHLSLVRRARRLVGRRGKVVVSIYVNPTQFGPAEDFSTYPRDLVRDAESCRTQGVDVVFAPADMAMYPKNESKGFSTYVAEESLSRGMEGAARPTHFRGVTTVLAKLFNVVQPQVAVFGAKDYQQAAVVGRMVRDLNFPLRIVVAPTFREPDGLAMSSRNKYLNSDERTQAVALWHAIEHARAAVKAAGAISAARLKARLKRHIEQQSSARVDYIEFFLPETLRPVRTVTRGTHIALAVFLGRTRLIDNAGL